VIAIDPPYVGFRLLHRLLDGSRRAHELILVFLGKFHQLEGENFASFQDRERIRAGNAVFLI